MTAVTKVNGVDVALLAQTIRAIENSPELATFKFRAKSVWINGRRSCTHIKDFYGAGKENISHHQTFDLISDEPDLLLGTDCGPNAVETVLHALASCLNATMAYHAAKLGTRIDKLEFDLEGALDLRGFLGMPDAKRNGFHTINITCEIEADASPAQLKELCQLAQLRSPVFDIITNPVEVVVRLNHNNGLIGSTA